MKRIIVSYWVTEIKSLGIPRNSEFAYSSRKRNQIIDKAVNNGLQVMLYKNDQTLIILIDNGRFRQR